MDSLSPSVGRGSFYVSNAVGAEVRQIVAQYGWYGSARGVLVCYTAVYGG